MKQYLPILILPLAFAMAFAELASGLTNDDFVHHEDQEFRFSAWYPKTWKKVPSSHSQTRLKAVSDAGNGTDDFSVVVTYSEGLKRISPNDIDKMLPAPDEYIRNLQVYSPDAKLVESGRTNLSSQPARFYITEVTARSFGVEVPFKQMQVQTFRNGYVFTVTCRTEPERFDTMLPVFRLIMAGFVIKPEIE